MSEDAQEWADDEGQADAPSRFRRVHERLHRNPVTGAITKVVITIVGIAVILVGVVLSGPGIPGPGFLVIILGLAILATEWAWADRLVTWAKDKVEDAAERAKNMDPAVRRRRILLGLAAAAVVVGVSWWYVATYDWPAWSVSTWDRLQSLAGFVPELPGM